MNIHAKYAIGIAALLVVAIVAGASWSQHVRDDAARDATIATQKSGIADLEKKIADAQSQAQAEIAALEKRKQTLTPAQAPTIIREVLPELEAPKLRSPEAAKPEASTSSTPSTASTLPSAPQPMLLSQQDQQDLAQYILSCKQCGVEHDQLQAQVGDQQQVIDKQKLELDAARKAAKGGSVWQRTKRAAKWLAIGAAAGYVASKAR